MRVLDSKQTLFLEEEKLNPQEFLSIYTGADYYKLYHIPTKKEVFIRR